ncbi:hypothetical protein PMAC_000115 [Pneumocystis sp. 'macacae']|nr:hypothetical protein PMAC_000115 [Pneumocystis sp. 'macacae']
MSHCFSTEEHLILSEHSFSAKTLYNDIDSSSKTVYIENAKAFRKWTVLYPIYFDVKRSIKGGRKVPINMAVADPLAKTIANGAKSLGFLCILESNKTHPKDWANPGRIRIFFKEDGKYVHESLKTKKTLYKALSNYLQANPTKMPMEISTLSSNKLLPSSDVPKGVAMGSILPLNSPALVNDEFLEKMLKDITKEQKQVTEQPKQKKEKKKKH